MFARLIRLIAVCAFIAGFAQGAAAQNNGAAKEVFNLTVDGCSTACAQGVSGFTNFGTVTLTQVTGFTIQVSVALAQTPTQFKFPSTSAGDSVAFKLSGAGTISITNITTGFAKDAAAVGSVKGYGGSIYGYGVDTTTGSGMTGALSGPLTFNVTSTQLITFASFIAASSGAIFSVDVGNSVSGATGNVAATSGVLVPEPISLALLAPAMIGLGLLRRRRG